MHPEIRQDHPGNCPICGMTLEPVMPSLDEDDNPELTSFTRRFWWTLPLTVVVTPRWRCSATSSAGSTWPPRAGSSWC